MGDGQKFAMASKINFLPGVIAVLVGGIIAFLLTQFQLSIWIEPSNSDTSSPPVLEVPPSSPPLIAAKPQSPAPQLPVAANSLRVSNQTSYPIRLVLLAKNAEAGVASSRATAFRKPVHWDFAPTEGGSEGLILSLPEGNLELHTGDVLMAFALDGSRHYWGPYIVGETAVPSQKGQPPVWELLIQP